MSGCREVFEFFFAGDFFFFWQYTPRFIDGASAFRHGADRLA
jgi:hypothetical protein